MLERSVPLGRYLAKEPVGVLVRCRAARASAGRRSRSGSRWLSVKLAWVAISAPWSQVIERRSSSGSVGDGLAHRGLDAHRRATRLEVQEQHEAGGALDEGADGAAAAFAQDEVAFPVAGHGTVGCLGGSFGEHDHAGDPATSVDGCRASCGRSGPSAGSGPAHGGARRGLGRTATGRSSRGSPASPGRRGSPTVSVARSRRVTTTCRSRRSTSSRSRPGASLHGFGRRAAFRARRWAAHAE